jgi:hypothetical protein
MNPQNPLKQLTHQTTQVAMSTGFLASALVGGGCAAVGREDELPDHPPVDAGEEEIVESIEFNTLETASHAYHAAPKGFEPVIMPLDLEDAPITPPPAARPSAPTEPRTIRAAADAVSRAARRKVSATDAAPPASADAELDKSASEERKQPAVASPARPKRPRRPAKDPIGESFMQSGGAGSYGPSHMPGGRIY